MQKPQINEIQPQMIKNHANEWRQVRETTASSMSHIPFGHYMAGTFNPNIAVINTKMAEMPITTGYAPNNATKTGRKFKFSKFRIIVLFEANFNMNSKWLGRATIFKAEQAQELGPKQYGSQKEKAANIESLNKQLFCATIWFNCQSAALYSNNAKSCYDRIILLVAVLQCVN